MKIKKFIGITIEIAKGYRQETSAIFKLPKELIIQILTEVFKGLFNKEQESCVMLSANSLIENARKFPLHDLAWHRMIKQGRNLKSTQPPSEAHHNKRHKPN